MSIKRAIVIEADGTLVSVTIESDQLKMLQKAVGGWIEQIHVKYRGVRREAYVDEEGKLKELQFNGVATHCAQAYGYGEICGPMVVVLEGALYLPS